MTDIQAEVKRFGLKGVKELTGREVYLLASRCFYALRHKLKIGPGDRILIAGIPDGGKWFARFLFEKFSKQLPLMVWLAHSEFKAPMYTPSDAAMMVKMLGATIVVIVDDIIETGGTMNRWVEMLRQVDARIVGVALLKRGKKAKLKYPRQVVVGKTIYNQKYIVFPWEKE
jgi:hypoxanthine phosphoribosyltransferase